MSQCIQCTTPPALPGGFTSSFSSVLTQSPPLGASPRPPRVLRRLGRARQLPAERPGGPDGKPAAPRPLPPHTPSPPPAPFSVDSRCKAACSPATVNCARFMPLACSPLAALTARLPSPAPAPNQVELACRATPAAPRGSREVAVEGIARHRGRGPTPRDGARHRGPSAMNPPADTLARGGHRPPGTIRRAACGRADPRQRARPRARCNESGARHRDAYLWGGLSSVRRRGRPLVADAAPPLSSVARLDGSQLACGSLSRNGRRPGGAANPRGQSAALGANRPKSRPRAAASELDPPRRSSSSGGPVAGPTSPQSSALPESRPSGGELIRGTPWEFRLSSFVRGCRGSPPHRR